MTRAHKQLGAAGEGFAARYLEARGFRILERNYRTPLGEIDLVVRRGKAVHFVEVKTRATLSAGDPFEQVTSHKQRQIVRVAVAYCHRWRLRDVDIHFDVMSVDCSQPTVAIDHLVDAFAAPDGTTYL